MAISSRWTIRSRKKKACELDLTTYDFFSRQELQNYIGYVCPPIPPTPIISCKCHNWPLDLDNFEKGFSSQPLAAQYIFVTKSDSDYSHS